MPNIYATHGGEATAQPSVPPASAGSPQGSVEELFGPHCKQLADSYTRCLRSFRGHTASTRLPSWASARSTLKLAAYTYSFYILPVNQTYEA